jgi:hypothetical protein
MQQCSAENISIYKDANKVDSRSPTRHNAPTIKALDA